MSKPLWTKPGSRAAKAMAKGGWYDQQGRWHDPEVIRAGARRALREEYDNMDKSIEDRAAARAADAHDEITKKAEALLRRAPELGSISRARVEIRKQHPTLAEIEKMANPDAQAKAKAARIAKAETLPQRAGRAIDAYAHRLHLENPAMFNEPLHKVRIRVRQAHPEVAKLERGRGDKIRKADLSGTVVKFLETHAPES